VPDGSIRLAPSLLSAVLNECAPPHATLASAVRWIERLVSTAERTDGEKQRLREGRLLGSPLSLKRSDPALFFPVTKC
jgi:hypothetical protein